MRLVGMKGLDASASSKEVEESESVGWEVRVNATFR